MSLGAFERRWNAWWFESEALISRLTTFRVAFFGLLGLDLWLLMVPYAQRHGFGEFNVSHVPALDHLLPLPTASVFTASYLLAGFLSLRVALGIALRTSLIGLTVLYNVTYFWSQSDSYQHHYLICMLLVLCCFVPFDRTPGIDVPAPSPTTGGVPSAAARLIYLQVSIVYFYTATTKVTPSWLDGWALDRIVTVPAVRELYASIGGALGWSALGPYAFVSHVIMLWQFFVASAFLVPKLRPLACITGPIFHALVEVIELKIGWFSYYMIATYYILLFPDPWFLALGRPAGRLLAGLRPLYARVMADATPASSPLVATTVALCAVLAWVVPLPGSGILAALVALTVTASFVGPAARRAGVTRAVLQAGIAGAMVLAMQRSDVPYDYYRFWASALRRQGKLELAAQMYERANAHAHGESGRHLQLAEIYVSLGRRDDAEREYVRALTSESQRERALTALQQMRATQ